MSTQLVPPASLVRRNRIIAAHRQLILEIRKLEPEISRLAAGRDPRWRDLEAERSAKARQIEPLIEAYPFQDLKGTAREQVLIDHELRFSFKRML